MILNSVLPLPGGMIPDYFFTQSWVGRSMAGMRQDLGRRSSVFDQDLRSGRLRVLRPTYLWVPSQWFIRLDDLTRELVHVTGRAEVAESPYGLIVPLLKTVLALSAREKQILDTLEEVQPLEDALMVLRRILPSYEDPARFLAAMELRGLVRYAFSNQLQYHSLRPTGPAPDYTQTALPHHTIGVPALSRFLISLTNRCPCRCLYCYYNHITEAGPIHASEGMEGARTISVARLKQAIDFIVQVAEYKQHPEVLINWWGGDPTEMPELVQLGTEYALQQFARVGRRVRFALDSSMVTVRARRLLPLIVEEGFSLALSADGPAELHNRNRPLRADLEDPLGLGSYASLERLRWELLPRALSGEERLRRVLAREPAMERPGLQVKHRCTLRGADVPLYRELVEHFTAFNQPFEIALAAPAEVTAKVEFVEQIIEALRRAQQSLFRAYQEGDPQAALGVFLNGHTNPCSGLAMLYTRCGFGGGNVLVSMDGNLYTCHRFAGEQEFKIGTVSDSPQAVEQACLSLSGWWLLKFKPCVYCERQRYCSGGGCAYESWLQHGNLSTNSGCPSVEMIEERARLIYIFNELYGRFPAMDDLTNWDSSHTRHLWFI